MTIILLTTSDESRFVTGLTVQFKFKKVWVNEAERQESREVQCFLKQWWEVEKKPSNGLFVILLFIHWCTDAWIFRPVMFHKLHSITSILKTEKNIFLYNLRLDKQRAMSWM